MVHYMPWFETPLMHSNWGFHWTMNHYNPNVLDSNGLRQIASQYYPLTGPYDSDDPKILEYQTLLMKITGIDGVLVKWDGKENYLDYGKNNVSTKNILAATQKAGLIFGISMEDYVVGTMITNGYMTADTAIQYGKSVMKYLQGNYFNASNYVTLGQHPVLLNFGPQYYKLSANWDTMFTVLPQKPQFFNEDNRLAPAATGAFPWPPMSRSVNGILSQSVLNTYLNNYYTAAASWQYVVTGAFPAFWDIYQQAGVHASYGYLDPLNGATFKSTLYQATYHHPDIIQIVTWNDWGEGTIVEPSNQFGYQYLEIIQTTKDTLDPSFPFQKLDLRMPLRIYNERVQFAGNAKVNAVLDRVYNYIIADDPIDAKALLDSLTGTTAIENEKNISPFNFNLSQNYPNPFNPSTAISYQLSAVSQTTLKVYDILGREITTLVNELQKPGSYIVNFNASNLPSGIYFYQLKADNYLSTKKMILLK